MERQQFRAFQRQVGKLGLPYASIRDKGRTVRWWMCCFPQRSWTGPTRSLRRSTMWEPNKRHRNRSKWQNEKTDLGRVRLERYKAQSGFPRRAFPRDECACFRGSPSGSLSGAAHTETDSGQPTAGHAETSAWRIRNRGRTPNNA